jgi:hypothetical protein
MHLISYASVNGSTADVRNAADKMTGLDFAFFAQHGNPCTTSSPAIHKMTLLDQASLTMNPPILTIIENTLHNPGIRGIKDGRIPFHIAKDSLLHIDSRPGGKDTALLPHPVENAILDDTAFPMLQHHHEPLLHLLMTIHLHPFHLQKSPTTNGMFQINHRIMNPEISL